MLLDTWFQIDYMEYNIMTGNNDQIGCFGFVKVSVSYLEYSIMTGNNDQVGCFGFVKVAVSYLEDSIKTGNNGQVGCFGFAKVSVSYLEDSIMTGNDDQVGYFGFVEVSVSYLEEKQKAHVAPLIFCKTHQLYFGKYIVINFLTIPLSWHSQRWTVDIHRDGQVTFTEMDSCHS